MHSTFTTVLVPHLVCCDIRRNAQNLTNPTKTTAYTRYPPTLPTVRLEKVGRMEIGHRHDVLCPLDTRRQKSCIAMLHEHRGHSSLITHMLLLPSTGV